MYLIWIWVQTFKDELIIDFGGKKSKIKVSHMIHYLNLKENMTRFHISYHRLPSPHLNKPLRDLSLWLNSSSSSAEFISLPCAHKLLSKAAASQQLGVVGCRHTEHLSGTNKWN